MLKKSVGYLLLTGAVTSCGTLRQPVIGGIYSDVISGESVSSNQAGNRNCTACDKEPEVLDKEVSERWHGGLSIP